MQVHLLTSTFLGFSRKKNEKKLEYELRNVKVFKKSLINFLS